MLYLYSCTTISLISNVSNLASALMHAECQAKRYFIRLGNRTRFRTDKLGIRHRRRFGVNQTAAAFSRDPLSIIGLIVTQVRVAMIQGCTLSSGTRYRVLSDFSRFRVWRSAGVFLTS